MASEDGTDKEIAKTSVRHRMLRRLGFSDAWGWLDRHGNHLAWVLAAATSISVVATYVSWSGISPVVAEPGIILALLLTDLFFLLSLGALIARRLVIIWLRQRSGLAGARLHIRFVMVFATVAAAPAVIVAVFSATFLYWGVQSWFSERVSTAVNESVAVAEAYVKEHRSGIVGDLLEMANDINRNSVPLQRNRRVFDQVLSRHATFRALGEATVFDSSGRVIARTTLSLAAAFDNVPLDVLRATTQANSGRWVIIGSGSDDRVRAIIRLQGSFLDHYLYVTRFVDPKVLAHVKRTRNVALEFANLQDARFDLQLTAILIFIMIAVMLLLFAVWMGLSLATRLVRPIGALVDAAEQVRAGDMSARVVETDQDDELEILSRAFNKMTQQLAEQQSDLMEANQQLDGRRRLTEAVLTGVSAGVIGLDREGCINLANPSAATLLETEEGELFGRPLAAAVPEFGSMLSAARYRRGRVLEAQVRVVRNRHPHIFLVRISPPGRESGGENAVVTFDDVTELVAAQRMAAWGDVARRIAHEIKNPLTPIQLAAERLKRRYLKEIRNEPELFEKCTDTIVRNVDDIGRMVDEFSDFARMPAPTFASEDISSIVRDAIFAQQLVNGSISYSYDGPDTELTMRCDRQQLSQVFANVLQNAADSILGLHQEKGVAEAGSILVQIDASPQAIDVAVIDNGKGLPREDREKLTEPYVTHRTRGTGLGLAIVKKIIEDHGGRLVLEDNPDGGAIVRLYFDPNATEEPAHYDLDGDNLDLPENLTSTGEGRDVA